MCNTVQHSVSHCVTLCNTVRPLYSPGRHTHSVRGQRNQSLSILDSVLQPKDWSYMLYKKYCDNILVDELVTCVYALPLYVVRYDLCSETSVSKKVQTYIIKNLHLNSWTVEQLNTARQQKRIFFFSARRFPQFPKFSGCPDASSLMWTFCQLPTGRPGHLLRPPTIKFGQLKILTFDQYLTFGQYLTFDQYLTFEHFEHFSNIWCNVRIFNQLLHRLIVTADSKIPSSVAEYLVPMLGPQCTAGLQHVECASPTVQQCGTMKTQIMDWLLVGGGRWLRGWLLRKRRTGNCVFVFEYLYLCTCICVLVFVYLQIM